MEQINDSRISGNFTTELTDKDYSNVTLSSLVPNWSIISLTIYIIIAMLIGLPGNSLVLIVESQVKRKTSTDWFVIFIAACDFVSLSVSGTLFILFLMPDVWTAISSEFPCKLHQYIIQCAFLQSLLLITCMGFDRYMKTCRPHSASVTPQKALNYCVIITAVSVLFNIPHIFTSKLNIYRQCMLDNTKQTLKISMNGLNLVVVFLCSVTVCIMYWKIAIQIRSRMKVGPSIVTNMSVSFFARMYRNDTDVLAGSHGNHDTGVLAGSHGNHDTDVLAGSHGNHDTDVLAGSHGNHDTGVLAGSHGNHDTDVMARSHGNHDTDVLAGSHDTVTPQHASTSHPEMQDISATTLASKYDTNYKSELVILKMCARNATCKQTKQPVSLNGEAATSSRNHGNEYQRRQMQKNHQHANNRSRKVDKTTKTIAAITLVFMISTVLPAIAISILHARRDVKSDPIARVVVFFTTRLYLINNFANPLFYISLSSEFRRRAVETLNGCKRRF